MSKKRAKVSWDVESLLYTDTVEGKDTVIFVRLMYTVHMQSFGTLALEK